MVTALEERTVGTEIAAPPYLTRVDGPPGGAVPEDDDALVEELTTLAGHIAAATCRFLVLLGELDARQAWAGQGIISCAHWLGWRCGMGPVAAREHVRVARALRALPVVVAAFGAGRLSYSKVRALTRVATAETEGDLVEIALCAPAHHLERLVRGLRTAQSVESVRIRHGNRALSWRWADDGSLLLAGRFSPEDGAVIVQALEDRSRRAEDELAAAHPPLEDADNMFGTGECEPLDPNVAQRRSLADALLELCEEAETDGTDRPRTSRSAETVVHVTLADLRDAGGLPDPAAGPGEADGDVPLGQPPLPFLAEGTEVAAAPQVLVTEALEQTPRLDDGPALHPETARRLACDGGIVVEVHEDGVGVSGKTLDVGARVRKPSAALVRALWARDHGCRYPGCHRRHFIHAHHVLHWADGGLTVLTNMVLLCGTHHRLLHEGGYTIVLAPDGGVTVHDRHQRLVRPVPATSGPADQPVVGDVDAWSLTPDWGGEPLDAPYATSVLLQNWALAAELAETAAAGGPEGGSARNGYPQLGAADSGPVGGL